MEINKRGDIGVLFVCTANVCRSPTAHGIFLDLVRRLDIQNHIHIDSAGTNASREGKPPEPRAAHAALLEGYDLTGLLSRPIESKDFETFHYIVCMDSSHLEKVNKRKPSFYNGKIKLLMDFEKETSITDVPDPYYGGNGDFKRALKMIEAGCFSLLDEIVATHF